MLKGSSPVKLSSIDTSAFARIAALNEAARTRAVTSINESISDFVKDRDEKKKKKEQADTIANVFPTLLKSAGVDIDADSPGYDELLKYVQKNSADDILGFVKGVKETMPAKTPTLQQIKGPNETSIYTFDGSVVDPKKVMNTGAGGESLGFEGEYPMTYMIEYNDGGTPDDPSDDRDAYRVQASTVNETSPGLKDAVTDQPINRGDQVYRDIDGNLRKVNLQNMLPFSEAAVNKYRDDMAEIKSAFDVEAQKTESFRDYIDARGKMSDSGAERFFQDLSFRYKNLVGDKRVTEEEYANALGRARFRQQLGGLRLDILGPGVLTEFDRQVIEQAIGGFGPTSNNQLAIDIINQYLEKSISKGKYLGQQYNDLLKEAPRELKKFAPTIDTSIFEEPSTMTAKGGAISSIDFGPRYDTPDAAEEYLKSIGETEGVFIYNGDYYMID